MVWRVFNKAKFFEPSTSTHNFCYADGRTIYLEERADLVLNQKEGCMGLPVCIHTQERVDA